MHSRSRLCLDVVLIVAVFALPFWWSIFLSLIGLFFFTSYWECVAAAFMFQLLYQGVPFTSHTFRTMLPFVAIGAVFFFDGLRMMIPEGFFSKNFS